MPTPLKPKYRLLTRSELQNLEKDFILFLASQGISVDLWQRHLNSEPDRVHELLIGFSDLILEKAYRNCLLLEEVTNNGWLFYHFDDMNKVIELVGITLSQSGTLNLQEMDRNSILEQIENDQNSTFNLIRARKPQQEDKVKEVDQMIKRGAFISQDHMLYEQLSKLVHD